MTDTGRMECLMCGNYEVENKTDGEGEEVDKKIDIATMTRHDDFTRSVFQILNLPPIDPSDEELSNCQFDVTYCKTCTPAMTCMIDLLAEQEKIQQRMEKCRNSIQSKLIVAQNNSISMKNAEEQNNSGEKLNSMAWSLRQKIIQGFKLVAKEEVEENSNTNTESESPGQSSSKKIKLGLGPESPVEIENDPKLNQRANVNVVLEEVTLDKNGDGDYTEKFGKGFPRRYPLIQPTSEDYKAIGGKIPLFYHNYEDFRKQNSQANQADGKNGQKCAVCRMIRQHRPDIKLPTRLSSETFGLATERNFIGVLLFKHAQIYHIVP